ncbi:MAG: energy transducer TonB [Betaproteobacteria bacterium]
MTKPAEIRSKPDARHLGSVPLIWAAIFSVTVHSALVAIPLFQAGREPRTMVASSTFIEAALVAPAENATGNATLDASLPLQPLIESSLPALAPLVMAAYTSAPQNPVSEGARGSLMVEAQPLQDRDRLGDELMTKLVTQFPVEIEFPVRMKEKIVARYPPAALAAGREGSVAVWVIVDASGQAEEIQVTEGSEEFGNSVQEAIRAAHFLPAQNEMLPIRFPITLEFQFKLHAPSATAAIAR